MKSGNVVVAVLGAIFRVVVVILAVYVIYQGALICYDYGYRIFTEPALSSGEGRTVTVAVTEDMSPSDIGQLLENKGLIRDAKLFTLQYYLSEYRKDVKPGIFELSTSMTAEDMMAAMTLEEGDSDTEGQSGGSQNASDPGVGDPGTEDPGAGEPAGEDPEGADPGGETPEDTDPNRETP